MTTKTKQHIKSIGTVLQQIVPTQEHIDAGVPATVIITLELISPAQATAILDNHNINNRNSNRCREEEYESSMRRDTWIFNGDAIRFDESGRFIDGQHRLQGIVDSGKSQVFIVVRGLSVDSQATIDKGKPRNSADSLGFRFGMKSESTHIAAAIKLIFKYNSPDRTLSTGGRDRQYGNEVDIINYVNKYQSVLVNYYNNSKDLTKTSKLLSLGQLIFLFHIFSDQDPVLAKEYLTKVAKGTNNYNSNEYHVNSILQEKRKRHLKPHEVLYTVIHGWNRVRANQPPYTNKGAIIYREKIIAE